MDSWALRYVFRFFRVEGYGVLKTFWLGFSGEAQKSPSLNP